MSILMSSQIISLTFPIVKLYCTRLETLEAHSQAAAL